MPMGLQTSSGLLKEVKWGLWYVFCGNYNSCVLLHKR